MLKNIDDGREALLVPLGELESGVLADQSPQLVHVDGRTPEVILLMVVVSHAHLSEVARVTRRIQCRDISKHAQYM